MRMINPERFQKLVSEAQHADFSSWDFSWLEGRMVQEDPPWDFPSLVQEHFQKTESLLDLGTGGGELLASLTPLPPDTHATESYPPNQVIAKEQLTKLGVKVHLTKESQPLPFEKNRFDLVISRHESYSSQEIWRILKPGGMFITQQVGGLDNLELNQILEDELSFPFYRWGLANALFDLYEQGFQVIRTEKAALVSEFRDIGAVIYYLKAIPWQVTDFNLKTHHRGLVQIHNIIESEGTFIATAHRFLIIAQKREKAS